MLKPAFFAPRNKMRSRRSRAFASNLGGRPGTVFFLRPAFPLYGTSRTTGAHFGGLHPACGPLQPVDTLLRATRSLGFAVAPIRQEFHEVSCPVPSNKENRALFIQELIASTIGLKTLPKDVVPPRRPLPVVRRSARGFFAKYCAFSCLIKSI